MRRRNFENFPTTKSSCGTRWGKKREEWLYPCLEDGRRMMRRTPTKQNKTKKQKKNHDNKIKPTPVQPRPRPPKIKNLKQPSSWAQIDTEERCSYVHHRRKTNQTKCNGKKEHHVMQLFIRLEAGGKEWGYEFLCQHGEMYGMYECVWLHMLPLYEGRVPCSSWVRNFSLHAFCSNFFLRLLGVLRRKRSAQMKMKTASVLFQ